MPSDIKRLLTHVVHGIMIGSANVIPGVSGGTMALVFGIYEDLIASLSAGFSAFIAALRMNVAALKAKLTDIDWVLVGGLAVGVVAILIAGGKLVPYLLETYPQQSRGLFFGLIVGSLAIPWLRMSGLRTHHVLIALVAGITAFFLVGLPPRDAGTPGIVAIFLTAVVAITAMILPGVSGAHLLLVLGMYTPTFRAIDERDVPFLAVFALGAGIGLGMFAKVLNWLLARYHDPTMAALIGLMAGSLRALWPWADAGNKLRLPGMADSFAPVILFAIGGFVAVSLLTWWSHRRHQREPIG